MGKFGEKLKPFRSQNVTMLYQETKLTHKRNNKSIFILYTYLPLGGNEF